MPSISTIYALAEPDTHEIRYCGKTVKPLSRRMSDHRADVKRQSHRHLYRWLNKIYDAGREPVTMVCEEIDLDGLSRNEQLRLLNEAETRWINQFKELGFCLTNATNGGDGSHGRLVSQETKEKMRLANTGRLVSEQTCKRISESCLQKSKSATLRGELHPQFGKTQHWKEPETRAAKLRGENNPNSSLKHEQVIGIYTDAVGSYKEIAVRHQTTAKVVCDIKTGRHWSVVTQHNPATHQRKRPESKKRC